MKSYSTVLIWLVTLIIVFGLACQPETTSVGDVKKVESAASIEAETKAAEAKARAEAEVKAAEAKARAEAEVKAAEEKARADAEAKAAEEKARAEAEAKAAEEKAKAEAEAKAAEEKAKAEAEAKAAEEKAKAEAEAKAAEEKAKAEAEAKAAEEKAKASAQEPAKTDKTGVAVTVNGVDITEKDVEERIRPQIQKMAAQQSKVPPQFIEQYKKQLMQKALEGMIVEQLLDEKVKAEKIEVSDEDAIAHLKEVGSQQNPPLSLEEIKVVIERQGQSFDQAKQEIKRLLSYNKLIESKSGGEIQVTEAEAEKYYTENKNQFDIPEQVRASHILIKLDTAAPGTDQNVAKAKAKINAVALLKQIKDGADFAELAKANSACGSATNGGDLGFGRKSAAGARGSWVAPFEKAAFALKPGQVSDVVETQFGYHIIKVTDHKDAGVTTYEQAKENILNMLKGKQQQQLADQYVNSLKADADIVYPVGKEPKNSNFAPPPPK